MKLSKENIQFIDNYLKNSEVIYYDIRMEMLDHVATAVEQKMEAENLDFYDTFKNYMVIHKKELMKGNKAEGIHFFEPMKKFCKFIIQPFQLFIALFSFFVVKFFINECFFLDFKYFFYIIFLCYLIFLFIHFLITWKKKFYHIDKNFSVIFIIYQIANFAYRALNENYTSTLIFNNMMLFVFVSFLRFYYVEMTQFKKRNQFLFQ